MPYMHKTLLIALLSLFAIPLLHAEETKKPLKIGVYYYDGWSRDLDQHGHSLRLTKRLKEEFPDREPVWGWQTTDENLARQIDLAADGGIDYFAVCWYFCENGDRNHPQNRALTKMLKLPNFKRLDYCLLVANHRGKELESSYRIFPKDWDTVCDMWIEHFKQPNHLRLCGKPLIIFFSPKSLLEEFGGAKEVREAFDKFRKRCVDAGLPGVTIAGCIYAHAKVEEAAEAGFDVLTGYCYTWKHNRPDPERKKRDYDELLDFAQANWNGVAAKTTLPYFPTVTAGWDMRPWEEPGTPPKSNYFLGKTPEKLRHALNEAVKWIDENPKHFPPDPARHVLIYAWNEFGEDGILAPMKKDGDALLKVLGEVKKAAE